MKKKNPIEKTVRFRGLGAAAQQLGCSKPHLSYVLRGQRKPGKSLADKIAAIGIKLPSTKK